MARTVRNTASYVPHPDDKSRKSHQREVNKRLRRQTREALRIGNDVLPVMHRQVDWMAH